MYSKYIFCLNNDLYIYFTRSNNEIIQTGRASCNCIVNIIKYKKM